MKTNNLKKFAAAFMCFLPTIMLFAQPGDNDSGGGLEAPDPAAPIDNYVFILLVFGLLFAFLTLVRFEKKH